MRSTVFILAILITNAAALTLQDIEGDIICSCGCYKLLKNCDCEVAERMREQIKDMIGSGMKREEIISKLQLLYGEEILATPPKEGFFASLWMYPVIVASAGIIAVYFILKRRNSKWFYDPDEVINEDVEFEELLDPDCRSERESER
jgi:cytochrome c-type biogenesis protein CcmH